MNTLNDRGNSLVLISAWNESGGGFTHRLFDGHPECFVYPFEIQIGTQENFDKLDSWFSSKYRWTHWSKPINDMNLSYMFDSLQDTELKGYLIDKSSSKFRQFDLQVSLLSWKTAFIEHISQIKYLDRRIIIEVYFQSFFKSWTNYKFSGREKYILGHCPALIIDFDKIYHDFPTVKCIHVIRSPYGGFVDFRNRIPSASLETYCHKWTLVNASAFLYSKKYPSRCFLIRYEDLLLNRVKILQNLCKWLDIEYHSILETPTWNSQNLNDIYPFGGVQMISANYEQECIKSLSKQEISDIDRHTYAISTLIENHP